MKTLVRVMAATLTLVASVSAGMTAQAEPNGGTREPLPKPVVIKPTLVEGTIAVPVISDKRLAGFSCSELVVTATSRDAGAMPPGGFMKAPKWTRTAVATGDWTTGHCKYVMQVPARSAFFLSATGHNDKFPSCGIILAETAGVDGAVTVEPQKTKIENMRLSGLVCEAPLG
jgi:hypothetical protein